MDGWIREIVCTYKTEIEKSPFGSSVMSNSQDVFKTFEHLRMLPKEQFVVVLLDRKNRPVGYESVAMGSESACIVAPTCVFRSAIICGAVALIFVHNHPSGDPAPSQEDRELTKRLKEGAKLLGLNVLDHVIIGDRRFHSMADTGEL